MIWQFVKDLFLSCIISVALIVGAIVGLFCHASQGSYAHRPEYKIRAREQVKRSMEFILSPVQRPSRLVPDFMESIPVIGTSSLSVANFVAFTPCFWAVMAFIGIRVNRVFKIITAEKLHNHFLATYGHLGRFARRATTNSPSNHNR